MLKLDGQLDSKWNRISKSSSGIKQGTGLRKIPNGGSGPRISEKSPWKVKPGMKIDGKISAGANRKPSIKIGNSTKLYSNFYEDDILDELLEKAFCEGYEYALEEREFNSKGQKAMRKALEIAEAKKKVKVPEFISSGFKTIKNPEYEKALNKGIGTVRWEQRNKNDELGTINCSIKDKAVYRKSIGYNNSIRKKTVRGNKERQMYRDHGIFVEGPNKIASSNKDVVDTIKLNRKWSPNKRIAEIVKKRKG